MFVIVNNNQVVYGPSEYNVNMFNYILTEELELDTESFQIPSTLIESTNITDAIKILKVTETTIPNYNSKIEQLSGPFYSINESDVTITYEVVSKSIDSVVNELKQIISGERYKLETKNLNLMIGSTQVIVEGSRDNKMVFLLSYPLLPEIGTVNWKFPKSNNFVACTKVDIGYIVKEFVKQTQDAFDWEVLKATEIDNCTTLEELDNIKLTTGVLDDNKF
jgi:hypothetical protein